jgi:hypothetical protein
LLHKGLEETASLWPPVRVAYRWGARVARVLANKEKRSAREGRRQGSEALGKIRRAAARAKAEAVRAQLAWFVKVTKSYWRGLFRCHESDDIPRTNNDQEHLFGRHRYHERRSSGRKRASPGLVVSGSVRIVSGLAPRRRPEEGLQLPAG